MRTVRRGDRAEVRLYSFQSTKTMNYLEDKDKMDADIRECCSPGALQNLRFEQRVVLHKVRHLVLGKDKAEDVVNAAVSVPWVNEEKAWAAYVATMENRQSIQGFAHLCGDLQWTPEDETYRKGIGLRDRLTGSKHEQKTLQDLRRSVKGTPLEGSVQKEGPEPRHAARPEPPSVSPNPSSPEEYPDNCPFST